MAAILDSAGNNILDSAEVQILDSAEEIVTGDEDGGELLLETGGILLLQDGGHLLLEGVAPEPEPEATGGQGMIDDLYGPDWLNARQFGAAGDGFTDSTIAIQAALGAGQNVYLPVGNYVIRQPLTLNSGQMLAGAGPQLTTITQKNSAVHGIVGTDVSYVTIRDLALTGPGTGSKNGINIAPSVDANVAYLDFSDVTVTGFGNIGVHIDTPIVSTLRRVISASNGGEGFQFSNVTGTPTSLTLDSCYADANTGAGYEFDGAAYCALNACASDGNGIAYAFYSCQGITLNGCGAETFGTYGWIFDDCNGCTLNGGRTYHGSGVVVHVTDGTTNQTINGLVETSPTSATASIKTDSGTTSVIINPTVVTAVSYASGTAYSIIYTGGTVH